MIVRKWTKTFQNSFETYYFKVWVCVYASESVWECVCMCVYSSVWVFVSRCMRVCEFVCMRVCASVFNNLSIIWPSKVWKLSSYLFISYVSVCVYVSKTYLRSKVTKILRILLEKFCEFPPWLPTTMTMTVPQANLHL